MTRQVSVAEYYSGELVAFVRRVLDIIPVSVFRVLDQAWRHRKYT